MAFPHWLEQLLGASDTGREVEVINAGGVSYASYRIRALMDELLTYEPDLFVVYTGQNEFLEERVYGERLRQNALLKVARRAVRPPHRPVAPRLIGADPTSFEKQRLHSEVGSLTRCSTRSARARPREAGRARLAGQHGRPGISLRQGVATCATSRPSSPSTASRQLRHESVAS